MLLKHLLLCCKNIPIYSQLQYRCTHILSPEYFCHNKWDELLGDDVMQFQLKPFLEKIDADFTAKRRVSATSMDLLASKLAYADTVDELVWAEELFKRFRNTTEYLKISDSLSHGLIRSYIDVQQTDRLVSILNKKTKFGIFMDKYISNILMDTLLEENNFEGALRIASEIALQEESYDELTGILSLISCLSYLRSILIQIFDNKDEIEVMANEEDAEQVKVNYIPNYVYDDHFDICDSKLLLGKTLCYFADILETKSEVLKVLGFVFMEKIQQCKFNANEIEDITKLGPLCVKVINDFINSEPTPLPNVLGNQMVRYPPFKCRNNEETNFNDKVKQILKSVSVPSIEECKIELDQLIDTCKIKLDSLIEVKSHQTELESIMDKWLLARKMRLNQDKRRIQLENRRKQLLQQIDTLQETEEEVTFFENQNIIEMHHANSEFADESPLLVEVYGEKEFNERYRKYYQLHRMDPKYYVIHRNNPKPSPPRFRVGAIESQKLEYVNLKHVVPEPERIM